MKHCLMYFLTCMQFNLIENETYDSKLTCNVCSLYWCRMKHHMTARKPATIRRKILKGYFRGACLPPCSPVAQVHVYFKFSAQHMSFPLLRSQSFSFKKAHQCEVVISWFASSLNAGGCSCKFLFSSLIFALFYEHFFVRLVNFKVEV